MACPSRLASSLASFLAAAALATSLAAQCELTWLPGDNNGPNGPVVAILELPNGDLVAGGLFTAAGSVLANNIARWDGTTWRPLGTGTNGIVTALVRSPNGDIVAGGTFTMAGGQPASNIARWNGSSWAPLGSGVDNTVQALLQLPNGNLVAGGIFHNAGGTAASLVAQWDGVSWSPLGNGFQLWQVTSLARMQNGDIIAGGSLLQGGLYYGLQRWDGVSWQPVPGLDASASLPNPQTWRMVNDLAVHPNGDLIAAGRMFISGVARAAVRWNGVTMQALDPAPVWEARALIARANGDVWVGGGYDSVPDAYRWNGTSWIQVSGSPPKVDTFTEDSNGRLLVGSSQNPATGRAVTRFDGVNWQSFGSPPPTVRAMVRMPNGDVVVGGSFASLRGVAANNLARWNGNAWSPLGLGVNSAVYTLAAAPNGDLIAAGNFVSAGGAPANRIARWDGQAWSPLGGGLPFVPFQLAAGNNGEVLAVASAGVDRFDGLTWSTQTIPGSSVTALVSMPNGDYAIGLFTGVSIFSGGTIIPLPGAPTSISHLLADSRGGLVAQSYYGTGNTSTQRWDGTTWTSLPTITIHSLGEMSNGELVASGYSQSLGGGAASNVYRLTSSGWQSFGNVQASSSAAFPVAASGRGEVFVGGDVRSAGSVVSIGLAHARPTCPAAVSSVGAGCTGGAGLVTLAANNTPWVGGVFRATASGMATPSLGLQLLGTAAPAQPLPGAHGCVQRVATIVMDLLVPSGGTATSAWAVPAVPSLAGLQVRMQVVGIELTGTGSWQFTSTNALDLTIGAL